MPSPTLTIRYLLFALVGGLSRVVFVRPTPINWDGVQFALALGNFDLQAHQPHPPGYILYVLSGRSLLPLWPDPAVALSMLSVLFSAAALPLIYGLARNVLEDERAGICAALLWLASPLALYYGSVGLTYVPEAVLSMAVAGLAWKARTGNGIAVEVAMGVVLGLAGGLRQTSVLVLLPLCVWALWGRRVGYRRWAAFGLGFAVTCALWLVPLLVMSGGLQEYLRQNALLAEMVSERTSVIGAGLEGLAYNITFEGLGLVIGLGFALVPLGLWVTRAIRFSLSPALKAFVLWWMLPALLFYGVSHIGQYGYMLVILPPLLLLAAVCAVAAAERVVVGRRPGGFASSRWGVAFCAVLAVGSAVYFTLGAGPITAASIRDNDAHAVALREALGRMDPADTVLVTSVDWEKPFRLVGYMFPAYHVYASGPDPNDKVGWLFSAYGGQSTYHLPHPLAEQRLILPAGTHRVIALDDETAAMLGGEKRLKAVSLGDGSTLYMLDSTGVSITALDIEDEEIRVASRR